MTTLRRHISWKLQKPTKCYQEITKKFLDYEIITTLITKLKKLKHSRKKEQSNEYLEGRVLEIQE